MNIGNIRTFLKDMVSCADPDLELIEDSFDDKGVTSSETQKGYKITFGTNANTIWINSFIDRLPVRVTIYGESCRDEELSHDTAYTLAYLIRDFIINPKNGIDDFTQIYNSTITPSILDTSDKTIKIDIELEVRNDKRF